MFPISQHSGGFRIGECSSSVVRAVAPPSQLPLSRALRQGGPWHPCQHCPWSAWGSQTTEPVAGGLRRTDVEVTEEDMWDNTLPSQGWRKRGRGRRRTLIRRREQAESMLLFTISRIVILLWEWLRHMVAAANPCHLLALNLTYKSWTMWKSSTLALKGLSYIVFELIVLLHRLLNAFTS